LNGKLVLLGFVSKGSSGGSKIPGPEMETPRISRGALFYRRKFSTFLFFVKGYFKYFLLFLRSLCFQEHTPSYPAVGFQRNWSTMLLFLQEASFTQAFIRPSPRYLLDLTLFASLYSSHSAAPGRLRKGSSRCYMIIGERLRVLREQKKMSQGDIEKRTGLLRCYLSRVENGHTVPAVETL
jgi:hypothetical protein